MLVEKFFQTAASLSAITDQSVLLTFLNKAAQELWDGMDFPNTLDEKSFKPYTVGSSFITLPSYVQAIRGVAPCSGETTDVYSQSAGFNDDFWINSPWTWRIVKTSPLSRNIANAGKLKIVKVNPKAADEILVTVGGKTDVADDIKEVVQFASTDTELWTENSYEDLSVLAKDRLTTCNLEIYDADSNLVSALPNNYEQANHLIIQIHDKCACTACTCCSCVRVLYKPILPPFWDYTDNIPDGIENALLFKFREWLDLFTEDKADRAAAMSGKADDLLTRSAYNLDKGKIIPFAVKRNKFTPYAGVDV
jgi:hypothetical protein